MALKAILWAGFFCAMCVCALWSPIWGIVGYVAHYSLGPERQWWEAPLGPLGLRYSFTLAVCTGLGIAINWRKLHFGDALLDRHEKMIVLFLGLVWLSTLMSPGTIGKYSTVDHPSVKMTKVILFILMLSHVVTDRKKFDTLLWAFVLGALILGMQAYGTPRSSFTHGRLDTIGGSDFAESNVLAAYLAAMLPLIGIMFLRSRWYGKIICFLAGGFAANAIVLTRSRGPLLGLGLGAVSALVLAPRKFRPLIIACTILGGLGGFYLSDRQYVNRLWTVTAGESERDESAQDRIAIWKASLPMLADYPLGVGVGNFHQSIGAYDSRFVGRDAHSTAVRCWGELGVPGLVLFLGILASALLMLRRAERTKAKLPPSLERDWLLWKTYAATVSTIVLLGCGLTITLLYVEMLWWFLALPVCLQRVADNLVAELVSARKEAFYNGVARIDSDVGEALFTRGLAFEVHSPRCS